MAKKVKKETAELPPARAGLLRFWDEEAPGIKVKPDHILYACGIVAAILAILHAMASL
ncbi:MAG: preprotein translocase subunit Sec61beta [Methanopyri archaeon]|nr:preprotein translocase subunit Sec61beta [Methanopyri archaeon]